MCTERVCVECAGILILFTFLVFVSFTLINLMAYKSLTFHSISVCLSYIQFVTYFFMALQPSSLVLLLNQFLFLSSHFNFFDLIFLFTITTSWYFVGRCFAVSCALHSNEQQQYGGTPTC